MPDLHQRLNQKREIINHDSDSIPNLPNLPSKYRKDIITGSNSTIREVPQQPISPTKSHHSHLNHNNNNTLDLPQDSNSSSNFHNRQPSDSGGYSVIDIYADSHSKYDEYVESDNEIDEEDEEEEDNENDQYLNSHDININPPSSSIKISKPSINLANQINNNFEKDDEKFSFIDNNKYIKQAINGKDLNIVGESNSANNNDSMTSHSSLNINNILNSNNSSSNNLLTKKRTSNSTINGGSASITTTATTTAKTSLSTTTTTTTAGPNKRQVLTKKDSVASLKQSRTSAEFVRNQIDKALNETTNTIDNNFTLSNNLNGKKRGSGSNDNNNYMKKNSVSSSSSSRVASTATTTTSTDQNTQFVKNGNIKDKESLERDRYGFKKTNNYISLREYNTWWHEYSPYLVRRKRKWEKLMAKSGLRTSNSISPTRFPAKSEELKRYVRKGIPAEWRGNAWFFFAKGPDKLRENPGIYDHLVDQTMDMVNENTEAIEKDLHRTFPENIHFNDITKIDSITGKKFEQESALLQTLRRVLKCFAKYKPNIGYCQSLNFITGLLLIFLDEEKAFWMLVIITERLLPGIHDMNLEGVNVHQGVLLLCIREYIPSLWPIINKSRNNFLYDLPPLSFCTTSWFMSIFVGVLPIETTLRVWDCLFYEDSKAIFQVSLAIFKGLEPSILKLANKTKNEFDSQNDHNHNNNNNNNNNNSNNNKLKLKFNRDKNKNSFGYDDDDEDEEDSYLAAELFQIIQNSPKKMLDANELLEQSFKFGVYNKLSQDEIRTCKKYVIETRSRYNELIQRRSKNLNEDDRRRFLRESDDILGNKRIGLKSLNWNGKLNNRMRRIQHKLK
ncbi:hypothetical protein B5S32_g636 [[Candida] boidinii]|nr:hypothetical protein B5S32_g636 [[Candida] boidinii]